MRGTPTVALHGEWRGEVRPAVRIPATDAGWAWAAPTGMRRRLAVVFTSPDALLRMKGSLAERYRRLLNEADILEAELELEGPPKACDATPYLTKGDETGLLRIGDADAALDPLSSSGVQSAIQSALCAGPVINTLLTGSADHAAAREYWSSRRTARTAIHRVWSTDQYAEASSFHKSDFWFSRAGNASTAVPAPPAFAPLPFPDQLLTLSEKATFVEAPCLVDGFVVRTQCLSHPNLAEPIAYVEGLLLRPWPITCCE
jgi:2-polyprenyl-6-methoxyphenol hydroxylase-like FAD-dependent oxidoreductase